MNSSASPAVALAPIPADASLRAAWESAYLSRAEASLVGPRATEKRRAEFVAGRLAAKAAAGILLGSASGRGDIAITREDGGSGRPRVAVPGDTARQIRVSISHADGLAVAGASRDTLGIDLVAIEDHGPAFEADAFAPGELHGWRAWLGNRAARHEAAAVAFAAKEAALKWMGTGLTVPLHGVALAPLEDRPAAFTWAATAGIRVLKVNPGGRDAFAIVPQVRLRVSVATERRDRVVLPAQMLRLENRVVLLLWGSGRP